MYTEYLQNIYFLFIGGLSINQISLWVKILRFGYHICVYEENGTEEGGVNDDWNVLVWKLVDTLKYHNMLTFVSRTLHLSFPGNWS